MDSGGNYRQSLGRLGEDMACRFLQGRGHAILERNWRSGHLEIDIISFNVKGYISSRSRHAGRTSRPRLRRTWAA